MLRNYRTSQFGALFSEGVEDDNAPTYEQWLAMRRTALNEDFLVAVLRWTADALHLAHPRRLPALPETLKALARPEAVQTSGPPDTRYMRPGRTGFVASAKDTSPAAILDAYGRGLILRWIFGRPTWWAPAHRIGGDPRLVQEPAGALALLASGSVRVTLDRQFDLVSAICARKAILRAMPFQPCKRGLAALAQLHDSGFGHSVEIWDENNRLIGGCHGLATGRVFVTQARFGTSKDASDLALMVLNRHLASWGYAYHDLCADWHGADFAFPVLSREQSLACLNGYLAGDRRGRWLVQPALVSTGG